MLAANKKHLLLSLVEGGVASSTAQILRPDLALLIMKAPSPCIIRCHFWSSKSVFSNQHGLDSSSCQPYVSESSLQLCGKISQDQGSSLRRDRLHRFERPIANLFYAMWAMWTAWPVQTWQFQHVWALDMFTNRARISIEQPSVFVTDSADLIFEAIDSASSRMLRAPQQTGCCWKTCVCGSHHLYRRHLCQQL